MPLINCQAGGLSLSPTDTCKTPPLGTPQPYVNMAMGNEALINLFNFIWCGGNLHNQNTLNPLTHGDEAGSMGGVASGTIVAMHRFVKGSNILFVQGAPVTRLGDPCLSNNGNAVGVRTVPSQFKLFCFS